MTSAGYRFIPHTADAGLIAWGATPAEAFVEAARGMYALMLGEDPSANLPAATWEVAVGVEGDDWDQLLVNWLAELLVLYEVDAFVPAEITIEACAPPRCDATLRGRRVGPSQAVGVAVKAITYHQLRVEVLPNRTEIQIIFDI